MQKKKESHFKSNAESDHFVTAISFIFNVSTFLASNFFVITMNCNLSLYSKKQKKTHTHYFAPGFVDLF